MKVCSRCGESKELSEFTARNAKCKACRRELARVPADQRVRPQTVDSATHCVRGHLYDAANASGYKICLECARLAKRRFRANCSADKTKADYLWTTYRLSLARYRALLRAQFRACKICKTPFGLLDGRDIHVDHDHSCCPGRKTSCGQCVRALLCSECNHLLGNAQDDVRILESAVRYLTTGRTKS